MNMRNKIKQYEILKNDPIIVKHLPDTKRYNEDTLNNMLYKYSTIYLKPNDMCGGNGILRVKLVTSDLCQVSFESTTIKVSNKKLVYKLEELMIKHKKYIIQEGIDLATYHGHPFDIRIVLQKVCNTWRVTLTSGKVGSRPDSVVTNVAKGAKDYYLHNILEEYDQKQNPMTILREVIDLAHQIVDVLGKNWPLMIAGLDLAIDKVGGIWFIESNPDPSCSRCKLVNDEVSVKKYEEAKKAIRSSLKKTET